MTLEEARELKKKYLPTFSRQGINYVPFVVPRKQSDLSKFINYLHQENHLSDSLVNEFSSDNDYFVIGIFDDGITLMPYSIAY